MTEIIHGSGGGKRGGGKSRTPVEARDNLHSTAYARVIDLISEGEIEGLVNGTDSIFLDGTPITRGGVQNFHALSVEERVGTQGQSPIPGFPAVENGFEVGVEVIDHTPWVQDFTNPELNAIRVQVSVPALSSINTSNGDTNGHTVRYAIDLAVDGGPFREVVSTAFSGKTTTKYERSHDIALTERASTAWTVRVRRTTGNANSATVSDRMFVDMVTEIIDGNFSYPNSAVVGIQVSSEHFQSIPKRAYHIKGLKIRVPSNYDPINRTYSGVWDGSWKIAWSNNPAWIFMDLATHPRYGLGDRIPLGLMDKWALYDIARYCDEMVSDGMGGVEPRFTCNTYIQRREEAYKVLQDLASVFRGMAYYASGIVTAVADQPKSKQYIYTNSKVVDGRFTYSGSPKSTRYTVALVSYNDPTDFFNTQVEYVEDRAGYAKYGHQETQLTAFGCSSRSQAHRLGKWALLTSQIETQECTFTVGLEGLYSRPGDVIQVADQDLLGEYKGGLIASATSKTITTDVDFEAVPGDTLRVMLPSGVAESRIIASKVGRTVTVSSDFSEVPQVQGSWLVEGEVRPQSYRVLSIVEKEGGTQYELSCIEYREDKFDFIDHGTRLDPRPVTSSPPSVQPPPTDVQITQRVVVDQGIANTIATISWAAAKHAIAYEGFWRKDEGEWVPFFRTGSTSYEIPNIYAGRYVARVYAINALDVRSVAANSSETLLGGKTTPPPVVTHLTTTGVLYGSDLQWGFPEQGAADVLRSEVWVSRTPLLEDAYKLSDLAYPQNTYNHGMRVTDEFFHWIRLVDKSGNVGEFYPDGAGVAGSPDQSADGYLDAIRGAIMTTETGQQLIEDEVGRIIGDAVGDAVEDSVGDRIAQSEREVLEMARLLAEAERYIREDEDSITVNKVETLEVSVSENLSAAIHNLQEVIVTADAALAQSITDLTSNLGDLSSTVTTNANTVADIDGKLSAQYNIKTSVTSNGQRYLAGIGLGVENDPDGPGFISQILLQADRVALLNAVGGGSVTAPFVVEGGNTFIRSAMIQDASIDSAKFTDWLESSARGPGGVPILRLNFKSGEIQMNNSASGFGRLSINNRALKVFDASNTKRVQLGDLTA